MKRIDYLQLDFIYIGFWRETKFQDMRVNHDSN